jgi:hypothetical protein
MGGRGGGVAKTPKSECGGYKKRMSAHWNRVAEKLVKPVLWARHRNLMWIVAGAVSTRRHSIKAACWQY